MNGVYYFEVSVELLFLWEDISVRKHTIISYALLTLFVMRSPSSSCY